MISVSDGVENIWKKEKMLITSIFSFSHNVFKGFFHQDCKNLGLSRKRLKQSTLKALADDKLDMANEVGLSF